MRIALISDIHANLPALDAALADIRRQGADQIVFLGDAATIGPYPCETLARLRALDCVCIMGNHDEVMLNPSRAADLQIGNSIIPSLAWGISQLSQEDFDFLRSFRPAYELDLDGTTMLCFHGSPLSNTDVLLATTEESMVDKFFAGQSAAILAGGHTHIQMLRQRGQQIILNPGSAGNAFLHPYLPGGATPILLPWAEYALVRVEKDGWSAELRRVPFDTEAVRRAAAASQNPSREWWLKQYRNTE